MSRKNPKGFIVHPNWTGNQKYHSGYEPNLNKTTKSFRNLREAKSYLAKKGIEYALYESQSGGTRVLQISASKRSPRKTVTKRRPTRTSGGFLGGRPSRRGMGILEPSGFV